MPSHTPIPKVSRLEVIATGARRRWTDEEKQRIVGESFDGPRRVSATARRYGLSPSQLFACRRQIGSALPTAETATTFLPAFVACEPPGDGGDLPAEVVRRPTTARQMEIALANGRRVIVGADFDAVALMRVLDVLERRA
jgi:transposase